MTRRLKIVYFGSGAFGVPTLRMLLERHDVRLVVTQPDKPAGRGESLTPTPIGAMVANLITPTTPTTLTTPQIIKPPKVNEPAVRDLIRSQGADAFVVVAFGQKLGRSLLEGVCAINLHGSILPRWRGASPVQASILAGDPFVGNSVIALADRMDAGVVYASSSFPRDPGWTAGDLHDLLAADGPSLIARVLDDLADGKVAGANQNESLVTLAPKLSKSDGWLDFHAGASACVCRIHGLNPWPSVTVRFRDQPLKLLRAAAHAEPSPATIQPGCVIDPLSGDIATGEGRLRLVEVQPSGKRAMSWREFAAGRRVVIGERLISEPVPTSDAGAPTGGGAC